jgi:hypothetical protein
MRFRESCNLFGLQETAAVSYIGLDDVGGLAD